MKDIAPPPKEGQFMQAVRLAPWIVSGRGDGTPPMSERGRFRS